jgi:uncharacterized protein (UPF0332 family)
MKPHDLIEVATVLVENNHKRPTQACLKRAISSLYYAIFHSLARSCANSFIGGAIAGVATPAWQRTYRSLDHGAAKKAFQNTGQIAAYSDEIRAFCVTFVRMQQRRHDADYDPYSRFRKSEVLADLQQVKEAISKFERCKLSERRAFAAYALLKTRG